MLVLLPHRFYSVEHLPSLWLDQLNQCCLDAACGLGQLVLVFNFELSRKRLPVKAMLGEVSGKASLSIARLQEASLDIVFKSFKLLVQLVLLEPLSSLLAQYLLYVVLSLFFASVHLLDYNVLILRHVTHGDVIDVVAELFCRGDIFTTIAEDVCEIQTALSDQVAVEVYRELALSLRASIVELIELVLLDVRSLHLEHFLGVLVQS